MALALEGLRVLDLSQGISGPACAMQLGDLGAGVVKIEPVAGDWLREIGPFHQPGGESELYLQLNRNKRGMTLDLGHAQAGEIVERLVRSADVVVVNMPLEAMKKLRLDYESLCRAGTRRALKPVRMLSAG